MPQPIDMQSEAARAYTAQRAMQLAQQALDAAQARVAMQSRQEARAAASQVGQPTETEHEGVNAEGRRREERRRERQAQHRESSQESGGEDIVRRDGSGGAHIDVSI